MERSNPPRVLAVAGFKKSGKTRVVEGLVRELVSRGRRVGTVKHIREEDFSIDQEGKDSWKHVKAGAKSVMVLSPNETALIEKREMGARDALRFFQGFDFVILEGFRELEGVARVVVPRNEAEIPQLVNQFTVACIGNFKCERPNFGFEDSKALADLVEKKAFPLLPELDCQHCGYNSCEEFGLAVITGLKGWAACETLQERAVLEVDGRKVPLNPFVQELVSKIVGGVTMSLKETKGKEIVLRVRRDEG